MDVNKKKALDAALSQIERQLLYISQNGIKILDQVGFEIPVGVTELPFGRFLNYGSVIAVPGINVRIAKKIGYRNADLVEEKWNNILGTPERALRWALNSTVLVANGYHKLFTSPREFALEAWETLADTKKGIANFIDNCGDLLRGKKTQEALPFRVTEDGEWLEFSTGQ